VEFQYLLDPKEVGEQGGLDLYAPKLLKRNQLLVHLKYFRDITHLRKNGSNGAANILDAESIFKYPLDNFVAGTEYSSFLAGNSTLNTPDVHPQNYHQIEVMFNYGVWDTFNAGIGVGYRSRSGVHQFTFADLASRQYQFEPYKFIDFSADWRLSENGLFTFDLHYVPKYKTFLKTDIHPKSFEVTTEYAKTEIAYHYLF